MASSSIQLWPWSLAPEEYRFSQGGDEDWVMFVPDSMLRDPDLMVGHRSFVDSLYDRIRPAIGICDTNAYPVEGGVVYVGTHA